jgi:2-polyprenyl-3-methyl-5-hydroxy-6-metoxy-1,4-benzoquinol methylase
MKKYAIILLSVMNVLNGMYGANDLNDIKRMHIALHDCSFDYFLTTYNLPIENRSVFHIGCSTGKNSAKLAQEASRVHAFDLHQSSIDIAKNKHQGLNNIFFEQCTAAHFDCPRRCDLALIDYTVIDTYDNTNDNRKAFFQCVNQHLSQDGELFLSIITSDNTLHPHMVTVMNIAPTIQQVMPHMTEDDITECIAPTYPSLQEVITMLEETGFENITNEEQNNTIAISEKGLWDAYYYLIAQNPILNRIPDRNSRIELSTLFIQSYMSTLQKNNVGKLLEPVITTIIRARKK